MNDANGFYTEEEIKERLSMSTVVFWKYRPIGEGTLGELSRNGITKIELLESREQYDMTDLRSMNYVKEICDAYGIKIVAYHAHSTHFEGVDTEQKRKAEVDRCRRQIDTMIELGERYGGRTPRR